MECHIEQMLYRDQRTIKTRCIEEFNNHHQHHNNRTICKSNKQKKSPTRFLSHARHYHQNLSNSSILSSLNAGVDDDVLSIRGVSNSSLYCYCHNQYFSKFKRLLYQTEGQCGYEGVMFSSEVSEKKKVRCKSWFKKFHNVLLLSTYLSLIIFPYASAVPTTISSRPTAFWNSKNSDSNPKKSSQSDMNITALTHAYRSAKSAADRAVDLKNKFRDKSDSDPEIMYKDTPAYSWLPQVPKPNTQEFHDHLKTLQDTVLDLFTHVQTIRVPIDQLEIDFKDDPVWGRNFSNMRGSLDNIIEDLSVTIADNNWQSTVNVDSHIMPDSLKSLNKTDQASRDWLIIRALVDVLEYTVAVFKHFNIPY